MILSDQTLKEMIKEKEIIVEPLIDSQIQPASIDLRLGSHYLKVAEYEVPFITMDSPTKYEEIHSDKIIIPPLSFILATTMEYIKIPNDITAFVEGRSSIGRMGLFIQNAGWVDSGFEGQITLELFNANRVPIQLESGRRICQLVFAKMDKSALNPYSGKYQKQINATGSRIYKDKETQSG